MPNIIHEKLKAFAVGAGLTSEQAADMTKEQAAAAMGIDAECLDEKVLAVARSAVVRELARDKWKKVLGNLKEQLVGGNRLWLKNNFPSAEFEIDHRDKVVRIHLEGKSTAEEVE